MAARAPDLEWAPTQNNLGQALKSLGERERGPDGSRRPSRLSRGAQGVPASGPLSWATIQNNLGTPLHAVGQREGNATRFTRRSRPTARRSRVDARAECLSDRATTQNNLGNCARRGLASLKAVASARSRKRSLPIGEALKERSASVCHSIGPSCTGNQGVALMQLAERRGDSDMAATAVSQIERALG